MLDVAENTGSDFRMVTRGLIIRSVCYCIGSLAAGYAFEHSNRQIGFAVSQIGVAIPIFLLPFMRNLYFYWVSEVPVGFFGAAMDVAPNTWILEIWHTRSNPPLQGMHSMFALGQCLAPIIAEPFLSTTDANTTVANNTTVSEAPRNVTLEGRPLLDKPTSIIVPYTLAAAVLVLASVSLFVLSCKLPYLVPSDDTRTNLRLKKGQEMSAETRKYHWIVVILGCLLFMVYSGIEYNSFTFFVTFATELPHMGLSKQTGAMMLSIMSFFYFAGRLASIYVATRVKTKNMLVLHLGLAGLGNLLLLAAAEFRSVGLVYASISITGYGYSSMAPGFYAFLGDRIDISNTICGYFMLFSTISSIGNTLIMGYWMESAPLIMVYTNVVSLAVCYLVMAAFYFTDRHFKRSRNLDHGKDPNTSSIIQTSQQT